MVGMISGMAGGATVYVLIKGVDQFSKEFKNAEGGLQKLSKATKIAAVASAGLMAVAVKQAATFERTGIAFEVMLGSAERAKIMLGELAEFSKVTPFRLSQLEENARLLLGMGIQADDLIPTMKSLGDVASGLNLPFWRLALNFGQVKSQGRLMGTELRYFSRSGVPIIQELAKNLDVAEASIKDMASKGQISFEMVSEAFRTMSSEGGTFADLMERSMGTVEGGISNVQDNLEKLARSMGTILLPSVNMVVSALNRMLDAFNSLDPGTKDLISKITVGAGVGVVAAGIGVKAAEMLRGTHALPMVTWEKNPAALGGGGVLAKGGAAAGALRVAGVAGVGIGIPLLANEIVKRLSYQRGEGVETVTGEIEKRLVVEARGVKTIKTTAGEVLKFIDEINRATQEIRPLTEAMGITDPYGEPIMDIMKRQQFIPVIQSLTEAERKRVSVLTELGGKMQEKKDLLFTLTNMEGFLAAAVESGTLKEMEAKQILENLLPVRDDMVESLKAEADGYKAAGNAAAEYLNIIRFQAGLAGVAAVRGGGMIPDWQPGQTEGGTYHESYIEAHPEEFGQSTVVANLYLDGEQIASSVGEQQSENLNAMGE